MKAFVIVALGLLLVAAGIAVGVRWGRRPVSPPAREVAAGSPFTRTTDILSALETLRSGDTDGVIEQFEQDLDDGIVAVGQFLEQTPTAPEAQRYRRLLARLKEYRARHPHLAGSATAAREIERALARPDEPTKR